MEIKNFTTTQLIDIHQLVEMLKKTAKSVELMQQQIEDADLIVMEQYYWRNNSAASCSMLIKSCSDGITRITVISSGGGSGPLNIDWGVSEDYMEKVVAVLQTWQVNEVKDESEW